METPQVPAQSNEETETGGFVKPPTHARPYENPPASKAVKERLKVGLMEVYYDLCRQLDVLARANQPIPNEIKIETVIDLSDRTKVSKNT